MKNTGQMTSASKIEVLLCDYDDCMARTEEIASGAACKVTNRLLTELGKPLYTQGEFVERFAGSTYRNSLHIIMQERGFYLDEGSIEQLVASELDAAIAAFASQLQPCEGADRMLAYMHEANYTLAVVSSSAHPRLKVCLEATGQTRYFDWNNVFSAQSSLNPPSSKPKPDIYLHAMEKLGVAADVCAVLEDSSAGVMSATGAGISKVLGYLGALPITKRLARAQLLLEKGALGVLEHMDDVRIAIELLDEGDMTEFKAKFVAPYIA